MKHRYRILSMLLAIALLLTIAPQFTLTASAATSGDCGAYLTWSYDRGSGTLTISGYGDMFNYDDYDEYDEYGYFIRHYSTIPWQEYSMNITSIRLPDGLTRIGNYAFTGCTVLQSINLPNGLESIGWNAFYNCYYLQSVTIPDSVTAISSEAFSHCTNLQSVTLSNSLTEIQWGVFLGCDRLRNVSIPSSVRRIETNAFGMCGSLENISLAHGVEYIGYDAFYGTAYYNNVNRWSGGLLYLGDWLIASQYGIVEANIRPGTVGIAEGVFDGNYSVARVSIPDGMEYICDWAFSGCEQLGILKLPNSIKRIGRDAFTWTAFYNNINRWSNGLLYADNWLIAANYGTTSADIRPGTRGIADYTFFMSSDLTRATLPEGLRYIGDYAFYNCEKLNTIALPNSVEYVGDYAFADCGNLKSLSLPGSLTTVNEGAFAWCTGLRSLTIPEGVRVIEDGAFSACSNLRYLVIPESVTSIGGWAFTTWDIIGRAVLILNRDCAITEEDDSFGAPYTTILYGYPGSTTEAHALKYGYQFRSIENNSFIDVLDTAYYADPVDWAVENGITNGTAPYLFSPDSTCTRAQVVTFLWRAAGSPDPISNRNPFNDVPEGQYYYNAVLWAVEQGITTGTSANRFSPDAGCTRGQVVTFLHRAMGNPEPRGFSSPFIDVNLGEYFGKAVLWAVENGVTNGTNAVQFSPASTCTRGQIVTFLYRTYVAPAEPPTPGHGGNGIIGISMPTRDLQRWNQDGYSMQTALRNAGYTVDLQFAANSPWLQISQIQNMIANGTQVLIIAVIDGEAMDVILDQAKEAGCVVIAYDRPIGHNAINYYVTFDNFSVGAAQGRFIVDSLDLKNAGSKVYNLEIVGGSPDDGNAYVFYDGAMSVLRPYIEAGTLNVVSRQINFEDVATDGWSSEVAQARFENLLTRYYADKPLHAVMASNDSTAQGVAIALENAYKNSVYPVITGQDCDIVSVKNMLDGKQAMSIFKDTHILAAKTVEMADAILRGSRPATNAVYTTYDGANTYPAFFCDPIPCTKDMVQSLLIDSGYYTREELGL